ncbi:universal stress protein PHOS34-like [Iris pallida]|uniref:Universal stress protein PHOS34-like n=1 Tax=Iris pallida TaxID=29817 RepID=A0AAX6FKC3_IRIPA|nr:universal stress protein PHOS34-like [Iris pallida]
MAAEKPVMVVGVDDSECSYYALQWVIGHFFTVPNPAFKLVLVHAKPTVSSVIGLGGPGQVPRTQRRLGNASMYSL